MRLRSLALTVLGGLAPLAASATGVVLSHGGYLLGANDAPLDATGMTLGFSIHDVPAGGAALWSATCAVDVRQGRYAAGLGDGACGSGLTTAIVPAGATRYLQVRVGTVDLLPRLAVSAVPSAVHAATADRLGTLAPTDLWTKTDDLGAAQVGGTTLLQALGGKLASTLGPGQILVGNAAGQAVAVTPSGDITVSPSGAMTFAGGLDASKISSGTIAVDRLPASVVTTQSSNLSLPGSISATSFTGSGSGLTNVPTSALSGSIPDAALSPNVPLLSNGQLAFRYATGTADPAACSASNVGAAYLNTSDSTLRICNGTTWARVSVAGRDGSSSANAGTSCKVILSTVPGSTNGTYWIDPDGTGGLAPFQVYCDMSGGGWTRVDESSSYAYQTWSEGAVERPYSYALSSAQIAAIKSVSSEGKQAYQCRTVGCGSAYDLRAFDGSNVDTYGPCWDPGNSADVSGSGTETNFARLPYLSWWSEDCGDPGENCHHNVDHAFFR